jgi:hypothetical protein
MNPKIALYIAIPLLTAVEANAVSLVVRPRDPQQIGLSQKVQVGLRVDGSTEFYTLTVAGGYTVTCPESVAIDAQTSESGWDLFGGVSFWINVPEAPPGEYPMSGWAGWPSPSTQSCSFKYVGRVKDGLISFGGFGSNITLGGGDRSSADTIVFRVVKPTPATDSGTCRQ